MPACVVLTQLAASPVAEAGPAGLRIDEYRHLVPTVASGRAYRFVLARRWRPQPGRYVLTVRVTDEAGNPATRSTQARIP